MADTDIDLYADVEKDFPDEDFSHETSDLFDAAVTSKSNDSLISPSSKPDPNTKLFCMFIGNLTWWTTDEDITQASQNCGVELVEIKFFVDIVNGISKGFCCVKTALQDSVKILLKQLPKIQIHGRKLIATPATHHNWVIFNAQYSPRIHNSKEQQQQHPLINRVPDAFGPNQPPRLMMRPPPRCFVRPPPPPLSLSQRPPPPYRHTCPPPSMGPPSMILPVQEVAPPTYQPLAYAPPALHFPHPPAGGLTAAPTAKGAFSGAESAQEFDFILSQNRLVSSSAIKKALEYAANEDLASAMDVLYSAIVLIKQSRISSDVRCSILVSSLQDTVSGLRRINDEQRSHRRHRSTSRDLDLEKSLQDTVSGLHRINDEQCSHRRHRSTSQDLDHGDNYRYHSSPRRNLDYKRRRYQTDAVESVKEASSRHREVSNEKGSPNDQTQR